MKFLLAEDDAVIRRLLEITLLGFWGCEVQLTCDGNNGCAALEEKAFRRWPCSISRFRIS